MVNENTQFCFIMLLNIMPFDNLQLSFYQFSKNDIQNIYTKTTKLPPFCRFY